jgi:hypothetical protein
MCTQRWEQKYTDSLMHKHYLPTKNNKNTIKKKQWAKAQILLHYAGPLRKSQQKPNATGWDFNHAKSLPSFQIPIKYTNINRSV